MRGARSELTRRSENGAARMGRCLLWLALCLVAVSNVSGAGKPPWCTLKAETGAVREVQEVWRLLRGEISKRRPSAIGRDARTLTHAHSFVLFFFSIIKWITMTTITDHAHTQIA